jgi:hypothetical protein
LIEVRIIIIRSSFTFFTRTFLFIQLRINNHA